MKVNGTEKLTVSKSLITIYRADSNNVDSESNELTTYQKLELVVSPLRIGFYHTIDSCFDRPVIPKIPLKDAGGKIVVDPLTREPKIVDDEDDADYRKAAIKYNRRIDALRVRDALRNDVNVEFDENRPVSKKTKEENDEIASGLLKEIEAFEFTEEEVAHILNRSEELTLIVDSDDLAAVFCQTPSHQERAGEAFSKTASDNEEFTPKSTTVTES